MRVLPVQAVADLMIVLRGQRKISRVAIGRLAVSASSQVCFVTLTVLRMGLVARSWGGQSQKRGLSILELTAT